MYLRSALFSTASLLALAPAAFATPATEAGAQRLAAAFQTYFTATPGVVSVAPEGETYRLTLDVAPLAAQIPAGKGGLSVSPLTYLLTDRGDGTWDVTENQAVAVSFDIPGISRADYHIGNITSNGVWDEALGTFSSQTATITDIETQSVSYGPDGTEQTRSTDRVEEAKMVVAARAAATGGVDADIDYSFARGSQQAQIVTAPDQPPMQIAVTYAAGAARFAAAGLKTHELYGLAGWGVAHPSQEAATAGQDELRGLLTSALPLFRAMDGTFTLSELTLDTPVGTFAATEATGAVGMNGIVSDGRFREAVTLKGLSVPGALLPEWSAGLVPGEVALDVTVTGFDLAKPGLTLLQAFDLTKPEPVPPELEGQLLGELLPAGTVDIRLAPGQAVSPLYTLTYEGQMTAGPGLMPTGSARITAQGLDKVQEQLGNAPPEVSGQVMMPLGMAMGLAKKEGDTLVWEIDATKPGALSVNGVQMMGGQ